MLDQYKAAAADGRSGAWALVLLLTPVQNHTANADAFDGMFATAFGEMLFGESA